MHRTPRFHLGSIVRSTARQSALHLTYTHTLPVHAKARGRRRAAAGICAVSNAGAVLRRPAAARRGGRART